MRTNTLRRALISAAVSFGLLLGSADAGSGASAAAVRFGPTTTGQPPQAADPEQNGSPDRTAPNVCSSSVCSGSDPDLTLAWSSATSTAGCRFQITIDWGDGAPAQTVSLTGTADPTSWPVTHTYPGRVSARHPYRIQARAAVVRDARSRGCSIESASVTFALLCTTKQLSGPDWSARWPGGDADVSHLNSTFGPKVETFTAAMKAAGITVTVRSTLRSPQRAYLMHFAYLVAKGLLAPQAVPGYVPLADERGPRICWVHRDASGDVDQDASTAAARDLLAALGVDPSLRTAPALRSRHTTGDAIDMSLQWQNRSITIKDAAGQPVTIAGGPRDGTHPTLIAVGATYGVVHFAPVATDRNHWSSDGR